MAIIPGPPFDESTNRRVDEPSTECRRIVGAPLSKPPLPALSTSGVRCLFRRGFVGLSIRRFVETGPTSGRPALAALLLHPHLHLEEPVPRCIEVGDIRHIVPRLRRIGRFRLRRNRLSRQYRGILHQSPKGESCASVGGSSSLSILPVSLKDRHVRDGPCCLISPR